MFATSYIRPGKEFDRFEIAGEGIAEACDDEPCDAEVVVSELLDCFCKFQSK
jgi:hypothetical protein